MLIRLGWARRTVAQVEGIRIKKRKLHMDFEHILLYLAEKDEQKTRKVICKRCSQSTHRKTTNLPRNVADHHHALDLRFSMLNRYLLSGGQQ